MAIVKVGREYVSGRWGQIHVHVARPKNPSARPLVCFHLSPGSGRMYAPFLAEMAKDREAFAPDTAGYGYSDPPPDLVDLGDYAAAHGDVIDALGLGEVDLLGAHTGSRLAVELAHQRPDQVRRLVLVGASCYSAEELAKQKIDYGPQPIKDDGGHVAQKWTGWATWRSEGVTDEMIGRYVADSVRDYERLWWAHRAVFEHDMGARLETVEQPVLVVCAADDIELPTRRAKTRIKNGRFIERLDWGHWVYEAHTAEFAGLVRDFLDAP